MVEDWALARLIPMPGAIFKFDDAYVDYQDLCANADLEALDHENFTAELKNIASTIGLDQSDTSLRDVALSTPVDATKAA